MDQYDPLFAPDAEEWMAMDEGELIDLVHDYHRRARVRLPNARLHATIHVVVETQIAMGSELPTGRTVDRLQAEGLDRHEAIHAVGLVLAEHMIDLMKEETPGGDPNVAYGASLESLTAEGWRRSR